ncbi:sulfur carrier protein ThiS [Erwiniaceae bacterium BAC15a-03b]|uniref:Sulfur carrier protein ThiS n=1 Tax=Winslowiella arboricola TaxID=2978220 RepID=A0A9J6PUC5_9GAMM|nr:sulfur carrier protein ThiS [Winslowiella arboricola]MCU5775325.1 sulfur carrier protein ThiS [Winslowiella arboricola]MCU5780278.1 sulfur carrier protein ThiS [Winslowiella arboricola]
MKIELNGQAMMTGATTLAELLRDQQIDISCVACALNGDFIPRGLYDSSQIAEGCQVEVLSPMQGG